MLIAIDYDGTYTRDPELWLRFVVDAKKNGHTIVLATMRHNTEIDNICEKLKKEVRIVCTSRKAKVKALMEMDIIPDIWIDDQPYWLLNDG